MLYYVSHDPSIQSVKAFLTSVKNLAKDYQEAAVRVENEIFQEGHQAGHQAGYQAAMSRIDIEKQEAAREAAREEKMELAKSFIMKGVDTQLIAEGTGLTLDEIIALKQSITN